MRAVNIGRKKRKYQPLPLINRVIDGRKYIVSRSMKKIGVTNVKSFVSIENVVFLLLYLYTGTFKIQLIFSDISDAVFDAVPELHIYSLITQ